jgi:hypothetical protein
MIIITWVDAATGKSVGQQPGRRERAGGAGLLGPPAGGTPTPVSGLPDVEELRHANSVDDTGAVLVRDLKRLDWSGRRARSSLPIRRVDTRELMPNSDLASSGLGTIHFG